MSKRVAAQLLLQRAAAGIEKAKAKRETKASRPGFGFAVGRQSTVRMPKRCFELICSRTQKYKPHPFQSFVAMHPRMLAQMCK
eukprot:12197-Heterococcus_DN1.PRE.1